MSGGDGYGVELQREIARRALDGEPLEEIVKGTIVTTWIIRRWAMEHFGREIDQPPVDTRERAIMMLRDGMRPADVAHRTGAKLASVLDWQAMAWDDGVAIWNARPRLRTIGELALWGLRRGFQDRKSGGQPAASKAVIVHSGKTKRGRRASGES